MKIAHSIGELIAEVGSTLAELERIASGPETSMRFQCHQGGVILVTRCASEPGKWRATSIDEHGVPTGHSARSTFRDVIRAAYDRGAVIRSVHEEA
jgi:hypothetical protein